MMEELALSQLLNSYNPTGAPPSPKLRSDSTVEQVGSWNRDFLAYIKSGKTYARIRLPRNLVMGYVSKLVQKDFYDVTLSPFILGHFTSDFPPHSDIREEELTENYIVKIVYLFFSSTILTYNRINAVRRNDWYENEEFDTFLIKAYNIIKSTNLGVLSVDQIEILLFVDQISNKMLLERVQKDFDSLFQLTFNDMLIKVRIMHNMLINQSGNKYTGRGETKPPPSKRQRLEYVNAARGGDFHTDMF